jgi:hypothetical protein
LWFVVEWDQKGHCHGWLYEPQLQILLVVRKLPVFFGLGRMISELEVTSEKKWLQS